MPANIDQIISSGERFNIVILDRSFKGGRSVAFQCDEFGNVVLNGGKAVLSGAAAFAQAKLGRNGAGSVTVAGAKVGDKVGSVTNLTTPGDLTSSFESVVTVAGAVQQTAATDLSAVACLFTLNHQTPANS
jgi:hypothetical protein